MSPNLQNKLEQKLGSINLGLEALKNQQLDLIENCIKNKNAVATATEAQIACLRLRERQLARQVEVFTAHQRSILDSRVAQLTQAKGALLATKEMVLHSKYENLHHLTKLVDDMEIGQKNMSGVSWLSVSFDSNPIASAVQIFGKLEILDNVTRLQSSKIEDSNSGVLQKNIEDLIPKDGQSDGDRSIRIDFPKIPKTGWLSPSSSQSKVSPVSETDGKNSENMRVWLSSSRGTEQQNQASKSLVEPELEQSFHMVESPHVAERSASRNSSISSSIEIISACDINEKDNRREIGSVKGSICSPQQEFACQANDCCKSYSECVLDGYCEEIAKERKDQTDKWLNKSNIQAATKLSNSAFRFVPVKVVDCGSGGSKGTFCKALDSPKYSEIDLVKGRQQVLDHMNSIIKSDSSKWIVSKTEIQEKATYESVESWLQKSIHESNLEADSMFPREDSDTLDKWLNKTIQLVPEGPKRTLVKYYPKTDSWLARPDKNKVAESKGVTNLDSLKTALTELTQMVPLYKPDMPENMQDPLNMDNGLSEDTIDIEDSFAFKSKWLFSNSKLSQSLVPSKTFPSDQVRTWADPKLDRWRVSQPTNNWLLHLS